jgi:5'-nucleotidase
MRRRSAIAQLRDLLAAGATIDETWHRTAELAEWRAAVEKALTAIWRDGSGPVARFRSVRWADDGHASEVALLEMFHLAVDDTLSILAAAVETVPPQADRWTRWLLAGAITVAVAVAVTLMLGLGSPKRFKIVQISDLSHIEGLQDGAIGGLARVRTQRAALENEGVPVLVVYAGGVLSPSVMRKYLGGVPMVSTLNLLDGAAGKFDPLMVSTLGSSDLAGRSADGLSDALHRSEFQWVTTNVKPPGSAYLRNVEETALIDVGGIPVGVIGLLQQSPAASVPIGEPLPAAARAAAALRDRGARVIIALTHQEWTDDINLAASDADIDLIIGGFDSGFQSRIVNGRRITKPDADARSVVIFDVEVPFFGKAISETPLRVVMDAVTEKDATVQAEVSRWLMELSRRIGGVDTIALTSVLLDGTATALRASETNLGNLLTDVMRQTMRTDIAIVNSGAIRLNDLIPPGPINSGHMEGIFYYNNRLVSFVATGADVLEMLRNSVSRADAGDGRFLQVSGLRFAYRKTGGQFTVRPEDVIIGSEPLALDRVYTVATIEFLYYQGVEDGYQMFDDARRPPLLGQPADFRPAVEQYLRQQRVVAPVPEGRIVYEAQ